eukprot:1002161-Pleurochrysis_carterae.AAC.1
MAPNASRRNYVLATTLAMRITFCNVPYFVPNPSHHTQFRRNYELEYGERRGARKAHATNSLSLLIVATPGYPPSTGYFRPTRDHR